MKRRNSVKIIIIVVFCTISAFFSQNVFAMDKDSMVSKARLEGVYKCIEKGAYKAKWMASDGVGTSGFMNDGASGMSEVKMPYGLSSASNNIFNCENVMTGKDGLLPSDITGVDPNPTKVSEKFMTLGYNRKPIPRVTEETDMQTLKLSLEVPEGLSCSKGGQPLLYIETNDDKGNAIYKQIDEIVFPKIVPSQDGSWFRDSDTLSGNGGINVPEPGSGVTYTYNVCGEYYFTITDEGGSGKTVKYKIPDVYGNFSYIMALNGQYPENYELTLGTGEDGKTVNLHGKREKVKAKSSADQFDDYEMNWGGNSMAMISGFDSNYGSYDDLAFTDQETYDLYAYYIKDVFKIVVVCEGEDDFDKYDGKPAINWKKGVKCKYDKNTGTPSNPANVYGVNLLTKHFGAKIRDLDSLIARMKKLDLTNIDTESGGTATTKKKNSKTDKEVDSCRNAEGAKSLGWILCPVIEFLGDTLKSVYDNHIVPNLQLETSLFNGNGNYDNSVRAAWDKFRDIANVIFIILLMVVIFSQLTGIGIDNYGIKKILPRLIVAAILINLSYLICLIMVDLSNIIGAGFGAIFDSMESGLTPKMELSSAGLDTVSSTVEGVTVDKGVAVLKDTVLSYVGVGGLLVGAIGVGFLAGAGAILSILVSLVGVVISVLFLFVLLAARKAAIVVLIVLSPLAVVAYMLPNTKKLFDKWWKLFEAMLLVYPIASLLVNGGDYVSKLLLSVEDGGGFGIWITAMVIGVIPIFFIPTVLKSSFSAMGKVGGMLSGLGDTAGKGTSKALRGTEAYKNVQKRSLDTKAMRRAGINRKTGQLTTRGKLMRNIADSGVGRALGWQRNRARYINQAQGIRSEDREATKTLAEIGRATEIAEAQKSGKDYIYKDEAEKAMVDAAKKGNAAEFEATVDALLASGTVKDKDIASIMRQMINNDQFAGLRKSGQLQGMFERMHAQHGNGFLSSDFELKHYMRSGGTNNDGKLGDYGDYAKDVPITNDEIKPEDLIKLSGDSLAGMAASGKISQSMAQRVMAMNPNISEDKKIMFGALASGAARGNTYAADGKTVVDGGTIGGKADKFKEDVDNLMKNHQAQTQTFNVDPAMVSDWTGVTAQAVNIVQKFQDGTGQRQPVWVTGENPDGGTNPGQSATSGSNNTSHGANTGSSAQSSSTDSDAKYAKFVRKPTVHEFYNTNSGNSMMLEELPDGRLADDDGNTLYKRENWSRVPSDKVLSQPRVQTPSPTQKSPEKKPKN